jgi:hypothetical protein
VKWGEPEPGVNGDWAPAGSIATMDEDLARPMEGLRDDAAEDGRVGVRSGFWRIRRRPDGPRPWSCSVIRGDLGARHQHHGRA